MKNCDRHWSEYIKDELIKAICSALESSLVIIDEVEKFMHEKREPLKHFYSWYAPRNITRNHQVLDRKPIVSHIRNSI